MVPAPTEAVDSTGIVSVYSGWVFNFTNIYNQVRFFTLFLLQTWFLIVLSAVVTGMVLRITALFQSKQIDLRVSLVEPGAVTMMIISSIFAQGKNIVNQFSKLDFYGQQLIQKYSRS